MLNFPPTEKLLLCCMRGRFDEEVCRQTVNLLEEKIDWEDFIDQARDHGIAASTYLHFKQLNKGIPEGVKNRLRKMYLWNVTHNLKLWSALEEILRTFNQANIEAIPLKGIFLAEHLHGHIGSRSSSDLDLLVRREDFPRAKNELTKIGYVATRRPYSEEFIGNFLRHQGFSKPESSHNSTYLEIHWNFYVKRPKEFDMSPVWKNATSISINGFRVLTLSASDTLLHLAINLRLHGYLSLRLFGDLYALMARYQEKIDWHYVIRQAEGNGQRVGLYYALYFARELLDAEIPIGVLEQIKPGWFHNKLVCSLLNPEQILHPVRDSSVMIYWDLIKLLTTDRLRDAVKILIQIASSYSGQVAIRYGSSSLSKSGHLDRFLRPFHLAWLVSRMAFQVLKK
ncbi:MAG TPA: hypothetical protein ENI23_13590 [bacterium]|nr:hypothetical protein [bacterium]